MRTTIEELYYGNIIPYNRSVRAGSEYVKLVGLLARNEAELLATLNEARKMSNGTSISPKSKQLKNRYE